MTYPNPSFRVNVDVLNPGQVLACCGLLELAHRMWPGTEGWLAGEWFCIRLPNTNNNSFDQILNKLRNSSIAVEARGDSATYPVCLADFSITLEWWVDEHGKKTLFKTWAGQQTSLRIINDLRGILPRPEDIKAEDLFGIGKPLSGRFGFDPRTAWNALDVGFSPNVQNMEAQTYPAVELLAAIGLQRFRPTRQELGRKSDFLYATWSIPLTPCVASAAYAGLLPSNSVEYYRFELLERGNYKGFSTAIRVGDK